jgi:hypothetical protein
MQRSTALLATCLLLGSPLTQTLAEDGWISLFDGSSLDGWTQRNGTATYTIEEGGIILGTTNEGSPNSFLCTDETYSDFELEFEVMVDVELNSGVQIRSKTENDDPAKRVNGPQVEVMRSPGKSGWIYGEATGRGWISPEPQSEDRAVNTHELVKNGEWNHYRVVAKGANIKTWINGEQVGDLTDQELYEAYPEGFIGLQVHGIRADTGPFEVRWRNIKIKPLK